MMGGYTHGIMTIRVPEDIAQAIHRNARELKVNPTQLIMHLLGNLADIEFAGIWVSELEDQTVDK